MNERSIFFEALEKEDLAQRLAYLDTVCADDVALRQRIEALLRSHEGAGDFLGRSAPQRLAEELAAQTVSEKQGETPPGASDVGLAFLEPSDQPSSLGRLGHYEVQEVVGHGGMGIVLRAFDEKLKRVVAIKVMAAQLATNASARKRFTREAQAAAAVRHEHVIDIHSVDEVRGLPLLVMEYVPGISLQDRLEREEPLDFKDAVRVALQTAQGLAAAHGQGVIHRDIKPANILLKEGTNAVVITDFGLARAMDDSSLSQSGVIAGTPQYMAPEQARSEPVDHRADIYALGVTLYQMLTGTTPFASGDPLSVLRQVAAEEPKPPRRLNRSIPADLETVVLKAMAKEAKDRYSSAQDLADDLERYLKHEPIRAKRPTIVQRARKWARRHQPIVWSAAMILVLAFGAVAFFMWRESQWANQAYAELSAEQERTQAALEAEAKRRQQAREALDETTSITIQYLIAGQPTLTEEHKKFLQKALQAYEQLAADTPHDEASRYGTAWAYLKVADIRWLLASPHEAESAYRQAVVLFDQLVKDFPGVSKYEQGLGNGHSGRGRLLRRMGRANDAEAAYRDAITIHQKLVGRFPTAAEHRFDLAGSYTNRGILLMESGRRKEAEAAYRDALAIQEQLTADFPKVPEYRNELAATHNSLGMLLVDLGRPQEAEKAYRRSIELSQKLANDLPAVPKYRRQVASAQHNLGILFMNGGQLKEAEVAFRDALAIRKQLTADFPAVHMYRHGLGLGHMQLGNVLRDTGRAKEAEAAYRDGLAVLKPLVAELPAVPDYQHQLAITMYNSALLLHRAKDDRPAKDLLEQAVPHHQAALKANPRNPAYRASYRANRLALTATLLGLSDHAAAAAAAEELARAGVHPANDSRQAAFVLARCVPLAESDAQLSQDRRNSLARTYADRAIGLLRQAVRNGFQNIEQLKNDKELDPLRSRDDFKKMIEELAAKRNLKS